MTGLRIRELMAMRMEDIDLERGMVLTRAGDNKVSAHHRHPLLAVAGVA
jgi:integrase